MFFGLRNYILREISRSFYYDLIVGSKIDDYIKYIDPDNHIYKLNGGNIDLSFSDTGLKFTLEEIDISYTLPEQNSYKEYKIRSIINGNLEFSGSTTDVSNGTYTKLLTNLTISPSFDGILQEKIEFNQNVEGKIELTKNSNSITFNKIYSSILNGGITWGMDITRSGRNDYLVEITKANKLIAELNMNSLNGYKLRVDKDFLKENKLDRSISEYIQDAKVKFDRNNITSDYQKFLDKKIKVGYLFNEVQISTLIDNIIRVDSTKKALKSALDFLDRPLIEASKNQLIDISYLGNSAPTNILLSSQIVNENLDIGESVANLITIDPDSNDTHTYKLISGNEANDNLLFSINNNKLIILEGPDYESKDKYKIKLSSTDQNNNNFTKNLSLYVRDDKLEIQGTENDDILIDNQGSDFVDGGRGIDKFIINGNFSSHQFSRASDRIKLFHIDQNSSDINTLKNIELIQFLDQTVEESKVDLIKTYSGNFSEYKFYKKGEDRYQVKTSSGYDDITGFPLLRFSGESDTSIFRDISAIADIKATFDQVTGLNNDSGKIFRLYNAAFKRLPDSSGLKYWINQYSSGKSEINDIASAFLLSSEFQQLYGENITDSVFVNTLYTNVLGREADKGGLNYWLGQLSSGAETRDKALLGFAESAENKALFTDMTGFG